MTINLNFTNIIKRYGTEKVVSKHAVVSGVAHDGVVGKFGVKTGTSNKGKLVPDLHLVLQKGKLVCNHTVSSGVTDGFKRITDDAVHLGVAKGSVSTRGDCEVILHHYRRGNKKCVGDGTVVVFVTTDALEGRHCGHNSLEV